MMKLTQEMVEAGAAAFLDALSDDVCAEVAARLIWRAMVEAKTAGDAMEHRTMATQPVVPEWLLERFRANPVPPLTPEQLAAGRRAALRLYGLEASPDAEDDERDAVPSGADTPGILTWGQALEKECRDDFLRREGSLFSR